MTTFLAILQAIPTLWKFWGEFKVLIAKVQEMKDEYEARKFLQNLTKASEVTNTSGDTSGYEDIIRGGRNYGRKAK